MPSLGVDTHLHSATNFRVQVMVAATSSLGMPSLQPLLQAINEFSGDHNNVRPLPPAACGSGKSHLGILSQLHSLKRLPKGPMTSLHGMKTKLRGTDCFIVCHFCDVHTKEGAATSFTNPGESKRSEAQPRKGRAPPGAYSGFFEDCSHPKKQSGPIQHSLES